MPWCTLPPRLAPVLRCKLASGRRCPGGGGAGGQGGAWGPGPAAPAAASAAAGYVSFARPRAGRAGQAGLGSSAESKISVYGREGRGAASLTARALVRGADDILACSAAATPRRVGPLGPSRVGRGPLLPRPRHSQPSSRPGRTHRNSAIPRVVNQPHLVRRPLRGIAVEGTARKIVCVCVCVCEYYQARLLCV